MIITKEYAVKYRGDIARIYISLQSLLKIASMDAKTSVVASFKNGMVKIRTCSPDTPDSFKILNTSRGAILEIRKAALGHSLKSMGRALVTATHNEVTIVPHPAEIKRIERESNFKAKLASGRPLTNGSLYSGIGLKNLHFSNGLKKAGISTKTILVNDICDKALDINVRCNTALDRKGNRTKVVCGDIRELLMTISMPKLDFMDISYPCSGMSTLAEDRDLDHPLCGDLFISTVAAIRASNPAFFSIECTPAFKTSKTLQVMKANLSDYAFKEFMVNSHAHGSLEDRDRVFVFAISKGLANLISGLDQIEPQRRTVPPLKTLLETIPDNSPRWKSYDYARSDAPQGLNYKGCVIDSSATKIPTLIATYGSAKRGSPLLAHPTIPGLYRLLTPNEHALIKMVPEQYQQEISRIVSGESHLTTSRGSNTLAHKLLGMSVEKFVWEDAGREIGQTIISRIFDDLLTAA